MDFKALQEKYQQLLLENNRLREEIKRLRTNWLLKSYWKMTMEFCAEQRLSGKQWQQ